jgi:adenosylcobinamide-GDP ribazoletransferase
MTNQDDDGRGHGREWPDDLARAFGFLTLLPLGARGGVCGGAGGGDLSRAARAFPLVGLALGVAGALVYGALFSLSVPVWVAAGLAVGAVALATGALHEDGLADTADGLGGAASRDDKLAVMRDSRIGVYGVLALVFAILVKVAAIAAIATPDAVAGALIAAHVLSRGAVVAAMNRLAPARPDGLAAGAGRPSDATLAWAIAIALVIGLMALGPLGAILAVVLAAVAAAALLVLAQRQIGGVTGDVLGAVQQATEIAVLVVAAALA